MRFTKEQYIDLVKEKTKNPENHKQIWKNESSLCILFIEFRNLEIIPYNLKNLCNVYGGTDASFVIVHSSENKQTIMDITKDWVNVNYIQEFDGNITVKEYDKLITSSTFWEKFSKFEHVLTNTWDSYLFKKIPEKFFKFDYVGSPCNHIYCMRNNYITNVCGHGCECGNCVNHISTFKFYPYDNIYNLGNGGFCLRNVKKTIELCKNKTHNGEPDDVYFSLSYLVQPSRYESTEFGVQDWKCSEIPAGCHKIWENHDKEYVLKLFNNIDC
jgi:hypothetical protein